MKMTMVSSMSSTRRLGKFSLSIMIQWRADAPSVSRSSVKMRINLPRRSLLIEQTLLESISASTGFTSSACIGIGSCSESKKKMNSDAKLNIRCLSTRDVLSAEGKLAK